MPVIDDLPGELAPALRAITARLKHDLGKYISFAARWLPPDATVQEQLEALGADLLQTRRGPDGVQDAAEVWSTYGEVLTGQAELAPGRTVDLSADADVGALVASVAALQPILSSLRQGDSLDPERIARGLDLARRVSNACRDLHRRVHEAFPDHG